MLTANRVKFFYLGTFLTSFGSLLFVMGIPSFFVQAGIPAAAVGITIAIHRFSGLVAGMWFGPQIDRFDSRRVILLTETLAAATSIGLILAWLNRDEIGLTLFWLCTGLRALAVGVQSTSRSRLIKLISGGNLTTEAGFAIWLNKVTQGAHALSALAALPLITYGRFEYAIVLDGISFLLGGAAAWALPDLEKNAQRTQERLNIFGALAQLARIHRSVFVLDVLLSASVSGTILLMVKLSGQNPTQIIIHNLLFGLCIWFASLFVHNETLRRGHVVYWITIIAGFMGLMAELGELPNLVFYFCAYMGYWILYHKYSVAIQTGTPQQSIGAVMAARGLLAVVVLSSGELLGGYMQDAISLRLELSIRAGIGLLAVGSILVLQMKDAKNV
ncbi:MAG: MFS transporter [Bdellovibrionaceae bacterium]|nr:MFS transporter [Pseudobdellovibrionaceae bacterium]